MYDRQDFIAQTARELFIKEDIVRHLCTTPNVEGQKDLGNLSAAVVLCAKSLANRIEAELGMTEEKPNMWNK